MGWTPSIHGAILSATYKGKEVWWPATGWKRRAPENIPSHHKLSDEVRTVVQALDEWVFVFLGGRPIQDLDREYSARWRNNWSNRRLHGDRIFIVKEYSRLVLMQGQSEQEATLTLENIRKGMALSTLHYNFLHNTRSVMAENSVRGMAMNLKQQANEESDAKDEVEDEEDDE